MNSPSADSFDPLTVAVPLALVLVVAALLLAAWRLRRGPTAADRILALDLATGIGLALTVVLALRFDQPVLLDVALALAVIGFVGTAVLARRLDRKEPTS
jgi:multisubunit Na+/H+ antiporter MnhF subunit